MRGRRNRIRNHSLRSRWLAIAVACIMLVTGAAPAFAGESLPEGPAQNLASDDAQTGDDTQVTEAGEGTDETAAEETDAVTEEPDPALEPEASEESESVGGSDAADESGDVEMEAAEETEPAGETEPVWTPDQDLPKAASLSIVDVNETQMIFNWTASSIYDYFEIEYAKNVLFFGSETLTVDAAAGVPVQTGTEGTGETTDGDTAEGDADPAQAVDMNFGVPLDGVDTTARYYVRVRGLLTYDGELYHSRWKKISNKKDSAIASIKYVKQDGSKVDVRQQAGKKLRDFSILQGCCTDGKFLYMAFEKRNGDDDGKYRARIKIARVRISDWKLKKVSPKGMKLGHANDITFNPNYGYIVATGAKTKDPYVRLVDWKSLKKIGTKKIKRGSTYSYVKAFNAIDFDTESRTYFIRSRDYGARCFVLDENFRVLDTSVLPSVYPSRSVQSSVGYGDYFIVSQSWYQSSDKNTITIFEKTGEVLQTIQLKIKGELEALFIIGGELYAAVHKKMKGYKTGYLFRILL